MSEPTTTTPIQLRVKMVARAALAYHVLGRLTAQHTSTTGVNSYHVTNPTTNLDPHDDYALRCAVGAGMTNEEAKLAHQWTVTNSGYSARHLANAGVIVVDDLNALMLLQDAHDEWAQTGIKTLDRRAAAEEAFLVVARELAQITTLDPAKIARAALTAFDNQRLCVQASRADQQSRKERGVAAAYYVDLLYPNNGIGCAIGVGLDADDKVTAENRPTGLGYQIADLIAVGLFNVAEPDHASQLQALQQAHDDWSAALNKEGRAEKFRIVAASLIPVFTD